jgi:hypothetical protein
VQLEVDEAASTDEHTEAPESRTRVGGTGDADAVEPSEGEQRVTRIWREWLAALAHDPEAALAAAQAYQQLPGAARDEWLGALEADADASGAPTVAVYAPLLAVEADPDRRHRIQLAVGAGRAPEARGAVRRALRAKTTGGPRIAVLVEPLYLHFVQVLACAYLPGERFVWVRHDPITTDELAPRPGDEFEGVCLEPIPLRAAVDDLARTVVAHQRDGESLPEALCLFADLFGLEAGVAGRTDPLYDAP